MACIEDGIENIGFRKISAYIKSFHPDTKAAYVPTGNMRGIIRTLIGKGAGELSESDIHMVAQFLAEGDLVGFSSMTQYSQTVHKIIAELRDINPRAYIIWGGIHPIIDPNDAIMHADAICTGEGEFAFKAFYDLFVNGKDYTTTPGFWFNTNSGVIKNPNLPLMQQNDMDGLPSLMYQDGELIYERGKGFKTTVSKDFLEFMGLSYNTVWTVGCPLKCTYCGNSKFIEYDEAYRRLRHSSPRVIIEEIKRAISKHPYISTVHFYDDSFLSLPFKTLQEFAELYKAEVKIPFAVSGIIPNYVKDDKMALLFDAGLNRVRMGIQSGSQRILDFYQRPTPLPRIHAAISIFNKYQKYMTPPVYDLILENPVETQDDTQQTLDLLHEIPRPFTLNIFALRVIPNTILAKDIAERGCSVPPINKSYHSEYQPTLGNVLVFAIVVWKIPRWLYDILRKRVYPVREEQPHYPILLAFFRTAYLVKRALGHLRIMDFSVFPGKASYVLWKLGVIQFWQRFIFKRFQLPEGPRSPVSDARITETPSGE
ncbi:B12-binding domain-containing radical SAM protein [Pseudomonadota bacterium]